MDVATIKQYREMADAKHLPMKVVADNEHWFLHNVDNAFELIWNDENETLYAYSNNNDYYSQCALPVKLTVTKYENIQFIEFYMDKVAAVEHLSTMKENGAITEAEYKHDMELLSQLASSSTLTNRMEPEK